MFRCLTLCWVLLPGLCGTALAQEQSALEKHPRGWIDLFPSADMKHWSRVGLEQGLAAKNPWSVRGDLLVCDGVGAKEMLLYDREFGDGIFHLEWRFQKLDGKPSYNAGAYVRSLNGTTWHQIQIAHLEQPPFMGDLFCDREVNGKVERVVVPGKGGVRVKPPGEWNTYEIKAKGKEISVWINGATTLTWQDCAVSQGKVGMQAEFFLIEFRNLKFLPTITAKPVP